jgi:peptide/nickel transport system substrate-binding protein
MPARFSKTYPFRTGSRVSELLRPSFISCLAVFIAIVAALGTPEIAQAAKKDDTLRFAIDQSPENLDPFFNNVRSGVIIGANVWDTLIYRDPKTNEYKGLLATSWKQVDEKTIDFELREGVKFHNGEDFDADSVVFTFNFIAKAENKVTTQANVNWIDRAEKIGKYKVRLITKRTFPAAIEYLAGPIVMHPAKYYAEVGPRGMNLKPVGTGPYRVSAYVPGKSLSLERNPSYFAGSPKGAAKIGKMEIRFVPDQQTRMAEVLAKGVDLIMHVPKDQAEQMGRVPHLQVVSGETMRIVFLQFNTLDGAPNKAFKDPKVRKAIAHAIDREGIVKNIVGAGARVLHTQCFPTQFGCTDDGAVRYKYDPTLAKKLLAEAGYPDGFETEIFAYRERNQTEAMINNLQAVGIKAKIGYSQYAAMRDQIRANKSQISHQTWGSFSVNDVSASTPVYFGFEADDINRDAEVRDLLLRGNTSVEPTLRKAAYKVALNMIAERAYTVPLWSLPVFYAASKELQFKAYPDEIVRFWEMSWK